MAMVTFGVGSMRATLAGLWIGLTVFLLLILGACEHPILYSEYRQIDTNGWGADEELFYTFRVDDTVRLYTVTVSLRYTPTFRASTLPLGVVYEDPHRKFETQTTVWDLKHESALKSRPGYNIFQASYNLEEAKKFPSKGLYTISLRHLSKEDLLEGLVEVGLVVN